MDARENDVVDERDQPQGEVGYSLALRVVGSSNMKVEVYQHNQKVPLRDHIDSMPWQLAVELGWDFGGIVKAGVQKGLEYKGASTSLDPESNGKVKWLTRHKSGMHFHKFGADALAVPWWK
ncbi:unnamed protein product [Dovyalis caffra]|uniref:Uncharacterized protein n=1 Tax=Dovyalis caffra TaxID=77055 RepID=A0AAV1QW38_9ROSI|nr:unnamed protein product [Dovyalis caffra]